MRVLFTVLALLSPLLVGCERPAATDYRTDLRGGVVGEPGTEGADGYERVMADGTRANLSGRSPEAIAFFRQALKMREARFRRGSPETALPLMSLALQLSIEKQYTEADARFAEAEQALRGSRDRVDKARLSHYRGIHMLNQKKPEAADSLLRAARTAYLALIPEDLLTRPPVPRASRNRFDVNGGRINTVIPTAGANDPMTRPLLLGLIETLRYSAVASRDLGRLEEADTLTAQAFQVAEGNDLARASVLARLRRTTGVTASARSLRTVAQRDLGRSDVAFNTSLPGTRPAAEAGLIHAGELMRAGRTGEALSACRRAVRDLMAISVGTSPDLMAPCLDAYNTGGGFFGLGGGGDRAEMFLAAQLAQGGITSHQIAQATAALQENARDPRVGTALKQRDRLQADMSRLYRALDTLGGASASDQVSAEIARLQREADQTQAALATVEAEVRTLSPNFSQLVQDVVPARDIFAALRPNEVFVSIFLAADSGWVFALRDGRIATARIEGGAGTIGPLVKKVRAGMEVPGAVFSIDDTRHLYDVTLGGVAGLTKGAGELVIAPTGALLSLPFEVLLTGPADPDNLAAAPWLIRQGTVTHVPAATNFVSLRKVAATSRAQKRWFGFGDFQKASPALIQGSFPDPQCARDRAALSGLPLLPGATAELQGARAILNAPESDALLGAAFTADTVMRRELTNYQVLHFAAHALLPTDLECQSEAAIVTSPTPGKTGADGWMLTASRLLGLELDANLVILSACNSGGGDGRSGESLSGLARSFFFARARSLMVSHWPVDDKFGSALVQLTMLGLKDKPELGVTGALRETQIDILDAIASGKNPNKGLASPYYWAPFAVVGEGGGGLARSTVSSNRQNGL